MTGEQKKYIERPHLFLVVLIIIAFAAALTYVVPLGRYELQESMHPADAGTAAVDPESFRYVVDEDGEKVTSPVALWGFDSIGEHGIMRFLYAGLSGGKQAAGAAELIAYLLIAGGAFGVFTRTGIIDQTVLMLSGGAGGFTAIVPPALFIVFSLLGAALGFAEAVLPLSMLIIPLLTALGFNAMTGVLSTFAAMQVGIACSWMSPLALTKAQSIAGIPLYSGARLRLFLWIVLTLLGAVYTAAYALRIYREPDLSATHADGHLPAKLHERRMRREFFGTGNLLVFSMTVFTLLWLIWGTLKAEYGLAAIASLLFMMALACGLAGAAFRLNDMRFSDIPRAFQRGAGEMMGAVLVIGMTQGMIMLLGGTSPTGANVLNTLLHWIQRALTEIAGFPAALLMYISQFFLHIAIPFDLEQAALSMPVMAPLADSLGISRQISVLAFQLGSSLAHLLSPTSGCLIAVLSVARLEWTDWLRIHRRAFLALFALAATAILLALALGYG